LEFAVHWRLLHRSIFSRCWLNRVVRSCQTSYRI
jgi:hypothetical protein